MQSVAAQAIAGGAVSAGLVGSGDPYSTDVSAIPGAGPFSSPGASGGDVETPIAADVFIDMAGASSGDLLTATNLAAGTHGTYSPPWTTSPDPLVGYTVGDSLLPMQRPVTVDGTTYSISKKSLTLDASKTLTTVIIPLDGTPDIVVVNGLLNLAVPSSGNTNAYIDLQRIETAAGSSTIQFTPGGTTGGGSGYRIRLEINPGTLHPAADINIDPNGTYWYSHKLDTKTGTGYLSIYDTVTRVLIGSQSLALGSAMSAATQCDFGNGETGVNTGSTAQQNISICTTTDPYPVAYSSQGDLPANPLTPVALTKGTNASGATADITGSVAVGDVLFVAVGGFAGSSANHVVTATGVTWHAAAPAVDDGNSHLTTWWGVATIAGAITIHVDCGTGALSVASVGHKVTGLTGALTAGETKTVDAGSTTNVALPSLTFASNNSVIFAAVFNISNGNPQIILPGGTGATGIWKLADTTNSQELNGSSFGGMSVMYQIAPTASSTVAAWSTGSYSGQVAGAAVLH